MFNSISAAMLETRLVCCKTLLGHSSWPDRASGTVSAGGRGAGGSRSRSNSTPVSSSSSSYLLPSESSSPESFASSQARIDSSYSGKVLRQCALSSLSSASGKACMNNDMSSSNMQMAVSEPSKPALAA